MVCARESSRTSVGCRSHTSVWPEPGSSWQRPLHYIHPGAPYSSNWMRPCVCNRSRAPSLSLSKNGIFHSTFKVMLCRRHYLVQREIPSRKGRKSWSLPLSLDGVVLWWWCVTQPSWMHFLVGRQPVQLRCARRAGNPRVVCAQPKPTYPAPSRGSIEKTRRFVAVAPQSRQ